MATKRDVDQVRNGIRRVAGHEPTPAEVRILSGILTGSCRPRLLISCYTAAQRSPRWSGRRYTIRFLLEDLYAWMVACREALNVAPTLQDPDDLGPAGLALGVMLPRWKRRLKSGGNPQVDRVLGEIWKMAGKPVIIWGMEARAIKAALDAGYTPDQLVSCWKAARERPKWSEQWMPMVFLAQDVVEFAGGRIPVLWNYDPGPGREEATEEQPKAGRFEV